MTISSCGLYYKLEVMGPQKATAQLQQPSQQDRQFDNGLPLHNDKLSSAYLQPQDEKTGLNVEAMNAIRSSNDESDRAFIFLNLALHMYWLYAPRTIFIYSISFSHICTWSPIEFRPTCRSMLLICV